jgi:hypothetical protein
MQMRCMYKSQISSNLNQVLSSTLRLQINKGKIKNHGERSWVASQVMDFYNN